MTSATLIRLALGSIRRNTVRSLLTTLGVVIGVGSVVVMVAIGQGAQREIEGKILTLGTNLVIVTPGSSSQSGVAGGAGTQAALTVDDAAAIAREALHVSGVTPVIVAPVRVVVGNVNWRTQVLGVDEPYLGIRAWPLASGRTFDTGELTNRRKVCILGATVAQTLFGDDDPIGRTIRVRDVPLEIVGVLERKGMTTEGSDQDDVILAPSTTVQTRLAGRKFIAQLLMSASSAGEVQDARTEVAAILRETHKLAPRDPDDFTIKDQTQLAEAARETTAVMRSLLLVVASVSLVVGGIGIMNIMLVSVTERTREIGIRRAVGARRRDVLSQFLVEAVALSGLGGGLGALTGIVVTRIVGALTGWATEVTPQSLLLALGFSAAVGVFFGWYPARRAAALDPIEALRFQ